MIDLLPELGIAMRIREWCASRKRDHNAAMNTAAHILPIIQVRHSRERGGDEILVECKSWYPALNLVLNFTAKNRMELSRGFGVVAQQERHMFSCGANIRSGHGVITYFDNLDHQYQMAFDIDADHRPITVTNASPKMMEVDAEKTQMRGWRFWERGGT